MDPYEVVVVGAGPAGMMAAIRAASRGKRTLLIEKNDTAARKMLITGKGRCNITNSAKPDVFIEKFGRTGQFLRTAFTAFSNEDLIEFFGSRGLKLKVERQGRVFPSDDNARSAAGVLVAALEESGTEIRYKTRLKGIKKTDGRFVLSTDSGDIAAESVVLATGGASYRDTGSSGEGFQFAKALGHTIVPLTPGLVPLKTKETWVRQLQGLTLKNVSVTFAAGKKKLHSAVGEVLITHFGVSGPLVLDLSAGVAALIEGHKEVTLLIDLKPGIKTEEMEEKLLKDLKAHGGKDMKNFLLTLLPSGLVPVMLKITGIDGAKRAHQARRAERHALAKALKGLALTVTGTLPLEEAMVTCGGVSVKEIDPRSMQSRVVQGLYFAGEIIAGGAPSGGYNLQQAFSTGYLAGESV